MGKNYRPEGYQEILARTMGAIAPTDARLVEAGADAMLEGLRKGAIYNTSDKQWCVELDVALAESATMGRIA